MLHLCLAHLVPRVSAIEHRNLSNASQWYGLLIVVYSASQAALCLQPSHAFHIFNSSRFAEPTGASHRIRCICLWFPPETVGKPGRSQAPSHLASKTVFGAVNVFSAIIHWWRVLWDQGSFYMADLCRDSHTRGAMRFQNRMRIHRPP